MRNVAAQWPFGLDAALAGAMLCVCAGALAADIDAAPLSAAGPWIRVAVVQNQAEALLSIQGPFRILPLSQTQELQAGRRMAETRVTATKGGIRIGAQVLPLAAVRVEPTHNATITLNGKRLRGRLDIIVRKDQTLLIVNEVELEDYLFGVLSKEVPHYWPAETLKAVAIAARTYTLAKRLANTTGDYDVTGDVLSQVYGGRSGERRRTSRAVRETEGLVLMHNGLIVPAFYHSTCGGTTERGVAMGAEYDLPPLRGGVQCTFCNRSPFYRWERRLSKADLAWGVKSGGRGSLWPVERLEVLQTTPNGRVERLRMTGAARELELKGSEFRQLFGYERIRSTWFQVFPEADGYTLLGHGWGHGVGLCQWGAAGLAERGLAAQEILALYYPGASVVRLGEVSVSPTVMQGGS